MPLNHFQFDLSMVQTGVEQAHGEFMFPGAAVEAVAELVEIQGWSIKFPADAKQ